MEKNNTIRVTKDNPIKCDGVHGEREYLNSLVLPDGQPIDYERIGSSRNIKDQIVDTYQIKDVQGNMIMMLYFDMYHRGYREKKAPSGLRTINSFKERQKFQDIDYFFKRKEELYGDLELDVPDQYIYIWTKSGILLARGSYLYAKEDAFGLPHEGMDTKQLILLSSQIVHELKGISSDYPLEFEEKQNIIDFFKTLHFKVDEFADIEASPDELHIHLEHIVKKDKVSLYLKQKS